MKIVEITTYLLRSPVDTPFTSARGWWYRSKNAMMVRVLTDEGIEGWGEAYGPPEVTRTVVNTLLASQVVGSDPFDTDVLWARMYQRIADYDPRGFGVAAISAIDIALWDIKGKALGMPVYALLGGAHRVTLRPYATGMYFTSKDSDHIAEAVEEAAGYRERGFTGVKMKIAREPKAELRRVQRVREELGDDIELMVDANHGYHFSDALLLGRQFEQMGVSWFEEPVGPDDLNAYRELRSRLDIPLAGGENQFTRQAFAHIIDQRAMDIIQPDVCCAGGITETMKIATLAEVAGIQLIVHVWGSVIGLHAAMHVMAALPELPHTWRDTPMWMEYEQTPNPFRDQLGGEPVQVSEGVVTVPDAPGLGLTVDLDVIERYRVA